MSKVQIQPSRFKAYVIVRDKLGRIVMDEAIFHDKEKLEHFRQEIVKNGGDSQHGNP